MREDVIIWLDGVVCVLEAEDYMFGVQVYVIGIAGGIVLLCSC